MFLMSGSFAGKIETWLGILLSSLGRLIWSNSYLATLPMFTMGMLLLQDGVHAKFDLHKARFYCEGSSTKRKYHLCELACSMDT
jgi:hypothetical protein